RGERHDAKKLHAYVVADTPLAAEGLRAFLRDRLPEYMVPLRFTQLAALPLSANGKVDRKALPAPDAEGGAPPAGPGGQARPRPDDARARIAAIVADVLALPAVADEANLLELGASSVDMVRVLNRLDAELGFRPGIEAFYGEPTIAGLARAGADSRPAEPPLSGEGGERTRLLAARFPLLLDPEERSAFRRGLPGIRRTAGPRSPLAGALPDPDAAAEFACRRTPRRFAGEPVPGDRFARLLGRLRQVAVDGAPRRLYGSAGGLYPVHVYVHVGEQRVEGLAAGTYYYHPVEHALATLQAGADIPPSVHEHFINRPIAEQAAFSLFLVADLAAIEPLYGEESIRFATLEAGLMSQLLESAAAELGLGLCPI
ncbi:MAG: SagB family peptide dehydrogenase, partial [Candidatus Eisenbacteria bacterium]